MQRKKGSLQQRILIPLLFVIIFEGILIYTIIFSSGTMNDLRGNAFEIFQEKLENRSSFLENQMVSKWANIYSDGTAIEENIAKMLEKKGASHEMLTLNSSLAAELLPDISKDLLNLLQKNTVTGAFVVLEGDGGDKKTGLYYRDSNPETFKRNNSDIMAMRAPSSVTNEASIALSSFWLPSFNLAGEQCSDFYYKPFKAALEFPDLDTKDLGYWSLPFYLEEKKADSKDIITYSIPLRLNGQPIGILGIELSLDYLKKMLPASELDGDELASYAMLKRDSGEEITDSPYETLFISGLAQAEILKNEVALKAEGNLAKQNFYLISNTAKQKVYGCVKPLKIYNANTPFSNEQWALGGAIAEPHLLKFFREFTQLLAYCIGANILIGLVVSGIVAKAVSYPITALTKRLQKMKNAQKIQLEPIHISEIDELTSTIQGLSDEVMENASKLETILKMVDVGIGACEYKSSSPNHVFCTGEFCKMLGISCKADDSNFVPIDDIKQMIKRLRTHVIERDREKGFYILEIPEEKSWVRIQLLSEKGRILAVASDITRDVKEKQKIEYDRDYDLLTNLYNRRAFQRQMAEVFADVSQIKTAAMFMLDLDNLKYVNDTYGHDCGDEYISKAASVLRQYRHGSAVVARLSGDEFMGFFYGQESKMEIRERLNRMFRELKESTILLPDGGTMPIRASAGISWYPSDAKNHADLIKYADFAMYKVKKTNKGRQVDFDFETYSKESYLLQCQEELNLILDKEMVSYVFQPIVSTQTAEVFAYEALMRPEADNIKNPLELLSLARSQSKLQQVERLTMFKAMEAFIKQDVSRTDVKIFINSISNQRMTDKENKAFEKRFAPYLKKVVMEFTEEEQMDDEALIYKKACLKKWESMIALDDFGDGYSSDALLMKLDPDFVKIDRSLITDIHKDAKKQSMLQTIMSYTDEHGIKVIAEGIECREEMEIVIREGVSYLQGYYLGRPSYRPQKVSYKVGQEILEAGKDFRK